MVMQIKLIVVVVVESFKDDDDDGDDNGNVKKTIGLLRKTTTLHVYHALT